MFHRTVPSHPRRFRARNYRGNSKREAVCRPVCGDSTFRADRTVHNFGEQLLYPPRVENASGGDPVSMTDDRRPPAPARASKSSFGYRPFGDAHSVSSIAAG